MKKKDIMDTSFSDHNGLLRVELGAGVDGGRGKMDVEAEYCTQLLKEEEYRWFKEASEA